MPLRPAQITFNTEGTPVASDFDDVYFSNHNGLEETRYVFIQNNNLLDRWKPHTNSCFVIAETGFGTGLNFLATWQAFMSQGIKNTHQEKANHRLHFISVEKFPLQKHDLMAALAKWPELGIHSEQLLAQYPDLVEGCHRLEFEHGKVILDLWFGDAADVFRNIHNFQDGQVDAWFLDGFAPSKNPDMWNDNLFQQMARLSKVDATFATFTAAGFVKRGLANQGFNVNKVKGFGKKREMLTGVFTQHDVPRQTAQYFYRNPLITDKKALNVAIVGAGLAGANIALSLIQRGCKITLICEEDEVSQGASGNPQGGFYPQLNAQLNITSHIQALSFGFAKRRYQRLLDDGFDFAHQWCGVLMLAFKDEVLARQQKLLKSCLWPDTLISARSPEQSSKLAGLHLPYHGLFVEAGGWLSPPQLVKQLICCAQSIGECEVFTGQHIDEMTPNSLDDGQGWSLKLGQQSRSFDSVVIATGANTHKIAAAQHLPFNLVRGQVEAIPSTPPLSNLKTVLCHKGYLTPQYEGFHALGSTYIKRDTNIEYRAEEQDINLATHQASLAQTDWANLLEGKGLGRAAIRCGLPDHLPVVGALFDQAVQKVQFTDLYKALPLRAYPIAEDKNGLYIFTGLGSRGLTTAPLMAEVLASQMTQQPLPLPNRLLRALNPNRFLIKDLIRQQ
ncbi:MAG: bifunctional tRNA (5-methylaminomethyl-2-thiouridine)(34)-methyltransferase MnmD/FAD-dependent 5-carboxymethylaminomethyl-2-thiouridine(34) oxidoreductase MnmC [Aliiglaciecola sp.]